MNAYGSSFLGGSAKLTTHVERSTYLAEATDRLLRLHTTGRARHYANPTDNSTSTHAIDNEDNADQPTDIRPGKTTLTINLWTWRRTQQRLKLGTLTPKTPAPTRPNGNMCAPPSAAPPNLYFTHVLRKTTISGSSLHGSLSARPLLPPATNSQRSTEHCMLRTPSFCPLPAAKCNDRSPTPGAHTHSV
jgi:hypothetical protein